MWTLFPYTTLFRSIDYSRGMGMVPLRPSRFIEELESDGSHPTELPYEQWILDED
jgi:hypothetical protein